MEERIKKAFDAPTDVTKQLITLATAIIGGFVAFVKSDAHTTLDFRQWGFALTLSFGCLALSIVFGLIALMQITGHLGNTAIDNPTPYSNKIKYAAVIQVALFALGTLIFVFGVPTWKW